MSVAEGDPKNRTEIVTIILYCGHKRPWRYGEHPRRQAFILCVHCNNGVHVKDIVRGRAA